MKKKCLVVACYVVAFLGGAALGKERRHLPGGSDWKNLSSTDHELYLGGFLQGYTEGVLHAGTLAMARFAPEQVSSMTAAEKTDYEQTLPLAQKVNSALTHKITGRDLESALSVFYGDYRNIPVCWDDAVILSTTSLVGSVATDAELSAARKSGATRGCR